MCVCVCGGTIVCLARFWLLLVTERGGDRKWPLTKFSLFLLFTAANQVLMLLGDLFFHS